MVLSFSLFCALPGGLHNAAKAKVKAEWFRKKIRVQGPS